MQYSLQRQRCETAFDAVLYTVKSMKECGYSSGEIDDYIVDAISSNNAHLVDVSIEALNECNHVLKDSYKDNFNDFYYDDDRVYQFNFESDEDEYGFKINDDLNDDIYFDSSYGLKPKHYWEDSDELEAYEGFDCCTNHYYDSDEDSDDYFELTKGILK